MSREEEVPEKPTIVEKLRAEDFGAPGRGSAEDGAEVERFGEYEVLGLLGRGGMGAVYKARQATLGRIIALKVLPAQFAADGEYVSRFQREAKVAASLNHPNLVRVYAAGSVEGSHYIAMELIEGENLHQRIRRERLSMEEALRICGDVARGLQYGWERAQLVHRDIKPSNIYLSHAGEVKVGDLGLAKSLMGNTTGLTQTGTMMGTPYYMSPEQIRGDKSLDFRADIYSLGCTLYELLTGQPPYPGNDPFTVGRAHLDAPLPAILKVLPGCPMPVVRLVGKMLKKQPRERYQTYEELVADIDHVREQLAAGAASGAPTALVEAWRAVGNAPPPNPSAPAKPPVSGSKTAPNILLYGGICAGLILLVAGAMWSARKESTSQRERAGATAERQSQASSAAAKASATMAPTQERAIERVGEWQNALSDFDPQSVPHRGEWTMENGSLVCVRPSPWAACELPIADLGVSYDLRYRITRGPGQRLAAFLPFRRGNAGGTVVLDYYNPGFGDGLRRAGIESMAGVNFRQSALTAKREMFLPEGKETTVLVQVREKSLAVLVGDEEILQWEADWSKLSQGRGVDAEVFNALPNRPTFAVGIFDSQMVFHAIDWRRVDPPDRTGVSAGARRGASEVWQDVLRQQKTALPPGLDLTPQGLRFMQNGSLTIPDLEGDGAVRLRATYSEGARIQLRARRSDAGYYQAGINGRTFDIRSRLEGNGWQIVAQFPHGQTIVAGRSYEMEMRVIADRLTAVLNHQVVGTVVDGAHPTGGFGITVFGENGFPYVVESIESLDLASAVPAHSIRTSNDAAR